MANDQQTNGPNPGLTSEEQVAGKEKLERLKLRLFPPETKQARMARALEALQKAKWKSDLDIETLKDIAQNADLEGL